MRDIEDVYVVNEGHGDGVTSADLAALAANRAATEAADLPNLQPAIRVTTGGRRCFRCNGRVYGFRLSADGERAYCATCVGQMAGGYAHVGDVAVCTGTTAKREPCRLPSGHPGKCRPVAFR